MRLRPTDAGDLFTDFESHARATIRAGGDHYCCGAPRITATITLPLMPEEAKATHRNTC